MKKISLLAFSFSLLFGGNICQSQSSYALNPLTSFGVRGDGSVQPLDLANVPYLDSSFNQRGMAHDPVSGNLVLVDTRSGSAGTNAVRGGIYVLEGTYGTNMPVDPFSPYALSTNGIFGGAYADTAVAIANDGVVYICNQVNNSATASTPFIIYRYDSITSTNPPLVVFSNTITPGQRYGTSMDIRGGGTGTQIIIGSLPQSTSGTNVVIFTTTDGTNLTAHVLSTDATSANFNDGIAFGAGDTFWAKRINAPLRLMSFNLTLNSATTIRSFSSTNFPDNNFLGPIAVDTNRNLMAAIEEAGGAATGTSSGPERVRLYDISNTNLPPQLLDIKNFTVNAANATAPLGYIHFGGGRLYSFVINNELVAYTVDTNTLSAPVVLSQPPATNRVVIGRTLSMAVSAYPAVFYQWQSNGVNIPGANGAVYTLSNIQTNFAALYTCVITNAAGSTSVDSQLSVVSSASFFHLNRQWSYGPGDQPYINKSAAAGVPNQRTIAYNQLSNHLYVVSRSSNTTSNFTVFVIDASTGNVLYNLNTNGIVLGVGQGGIGLTSIRVASDGAIYACNTAINANGDGGADPTKMWRVYRWADANSNTLPVQIYLGDPAIAAGFAGATTVIRWGDSMNIRGSGQNTQLIFDNNDAAARYVAILHPTDSTMTNWTADAYHSFSIVGTSIGRSLEFGPGNTFWQRRNSSPLIQSSFDSDPTSILGTFSNFTNNLNGLGLDLTRNIAVGVNISNFNATLFTPDTLDLYEVSDLNAPLLLAQYNFPANFGTNHNQNANFISEGFFTADNKVFTLDAQNGIMAFTVASGPPSPPIFLVQPRDTRVLQGTSAGLQVAVDQQAAFQWQFEGTNIAGATNASLLLPNFQAGNVGHYRVIAANVFGVSTSSVAVTSMILPQDNYSLSPIWSLAPSSRPYLPTDSDSNGNTPLYRGIAYNPLSDQVYVVSRTSATAGLSINVLDAASGADLYALNTTGISGGNIILLSMGVAADGALYAVNMDTSLGGTNPPASLRLYRWADSGSNTLPQLVYSGEPANQGVPYRWGDAMDVRGAGTNTQIVIDNLQGIFGAVLVPTDSTMANFINAPFTQSAPNTTPIGRSLQFGPTNTVWEKRSGDSLLLRSVNITNGSSSTLATFGGFPTTLGPVTLDPTRNLLAGISFSATGTPDKVALYEVTDLNTPVLLSSYSFPVNHRANNNMIGQVVFAGNRVWAVDGNNGITAFNVSGPKLNIAPAGVNNVITWPLFNGFTLQASPSLASPTSWTNVGTGTVINGTNTLTAPARTPGLFYRLQK